MVYAVPGIPHQFYGDVFVNGNPASGAKIVAWVGPDDLNEGETLSVSGTYGEKPNLFFVENRDSNGDTIRFSLNGTDVATYIFESGALTELDLNIGPLPVCGDGSCNGFEGCSSCPTDCGECSQGDPGNGSPGGNGPGGSGPSGSNPPADTNEPADANTDGTDGTNGTDGSDNQPSADACENVNCDDGNPCTSEECEDGFCVYEQLSNNPCGDSGTCQTGVCVVVEPAPFTGLFGLGIAGTAGIGLLLIAIIVIVLLLIRSRKKKA